MRLQAVKYYVNKGEHAKIKKEKHKEDKHLAAFGQYVLKFEIPFAISKGLESLYQKTKKLEDLDLKKAVDIFKQQVPIEVTVIKDETLAQQVQREIMKDFQKRAKSL